MARTSSFLVFFVLGIMLFSSCSHSLATPDIQKNTTNKQTIDPFLIQLSDNHIDLIDTYLSNISNPTSKNKIENMLEEVLSEENKLNVKNFVNMLEEYGFEKVYNNEQTTELTDDFFMFLLEMIQDRLGWVYDFYQKTSNIIYDAQNLWNDKDLPKEIIDEINTLIEQLKELQVLLTYLVEKQYIAFLKAWSPGIIIQDLTEIITTIESLATNIGILVGDIQRFIFDVSDFISWFSNEPWKQPIHIYGQVMKGIFGVANISVSCYGESSITDSEGYFDFYVNCTPTNDSIPPDSYYGLHQYIVSIDHNTEEKKSPDELSYVFSDGGIYWLFILNNNRSTDQTLLDNPIMFTNCNVELSGEIATIDWPRIIGSNMWKMMYFPLRNENAVALYWQIVMDESSEVNIYSNRDNELIWAHDGNGYPQLRIIGYHGKYINDIDSSHMMLSGKSLVIAITLR